jgi:hypothetical protein
MRAFPINFSAHVQRACDPAFGLRFRFDLLQLIEHFTGERHRPFWFFGLM